jgi:transmembrane sensor
LVPDPGGFPLDAEGLDRYLAGTATAAEVAAVEAWITGRPERAALLETLRTVGRDETVTPLTLDVERGWAEARARMRRAGRERRSKSREVAGRRWVTVASLVGIAAALVVGVYFGGAAIHVPWSERVGAGREYVTAAGQRESIVLPDGTRFTLGPASRLRLAADYGVSARRVSLDGEAYFEVVHNARRPFVVAARNAVTEDVGTRFVVRAYPGEPGVRVVVAEGAVAVSGSVLGRGAIGVVNGQGQLAVTRGANVDAYLGWTRGELSFVNTPIREVLADVGRWYGLDVQVTDSGLARGVLTAAYGDESLDDVLHSLALALGARLERDGSRVRFVPMARRGRP